MPGESRLRQGVMALFAALCVALHATEPSEPGAAAERLDARASAGPGGGDGGPPDAVLGMEAAKRDAERIGLLERRLGELARENAALRSQLSAVAATVEQLAAPSATRERELKSANLENGSGAANRIVVGGLAQIQGEAGGAPDARYAGVADRFQLRRLRLAVAGSLPEHFVFKLETEFGNGAVAGNSACRGQLTDAYVAWARTPELQLQVGQFKTPFGYEQLIGEPTAVFVERTLANDRLTVGRQIGAMATGDVLGGKVRFSLGVFNGNGPNTGANDNSKFMTCARLAAVVFDRKLRTGPVSWTVGTDYFNTVDTGVFNGRRTGCGVDTQLKTGAAELGAEWLRNDLHPHGGATNTAAGWSAYVAQRVLPQWQLVIRRESFDATTAHPAPVVEWTYGVNYLLKGDDLKLSLNYLRGTPPAPAHPDGRLLGRVQVVF